jgi:hypothetical protein
VTRSISNIYYSAATSSRCHCHFSGLCSLGVNA